MNNPIIQNGHLTLGGKPAKACPPDIAEILKKLDQRFDKIEQRFDKIDQKFDKVDERLGKIEVSLGKLEQRFEAQENTVNELKGSQNKQIWALITLAFTAVISLLIGLGKFIFFPNT